MSVTCPFCNHENLLGADTCARCFVALTDIISLKEQSDIEIDLIHRPLGEIMTTSFVSVPANATVGDAIQKLNSDGNHCAAVVDENGSIVGIFTERDVLFKIADHYDKRDSAPIREYMTPRPETLKASDPLAFGLNRMMVGGYRHIPIEEEGKLVGVVSVRHILEYLAKRFPDAIYASAPV